MRSNSPLNIWAPIFREGHLPSPAPAATVSLFLSLYLPISLYFASEESIGPQKTNHTECLLCEEDSHREISIYVQWMEAASIHSRLCKFFTRRAIYYWSTNSVGINAITNTNTYIYIYLLYVRVRIYLLKVIIIEYRRVCVQLPHTSNIYHDCKVQLGQMLVQIVVGCSIYFFRKCKDAHAYLYNLIADACKHQTVFAKFIASCSWLG